MTAAAQGVGGNIIYFSFGEGKTNPGSPLPAGNTRFNFDPDSCPAPGTYTVTNNLYRCPSNRMGRSIDNTPASNYGYMMLVNDTTSSKVRLLFVDTVTTPLCEQTEYEFSAYFLNTAIPGYCSTGEHFPRFTLRVETLTGTTIQSTSTGPMGYDYSTGMAPKFHFFSVRFYPPAGSLGIIVKIEDNDALVVPCGYTYAVDDIRLTSRGPDASITFDDANGLELSRSVCYQDNKTISMSGILAAGYTNPVLQWQQSADSGLTWIDVAGATTDHFSAPFSTPGLFLVRMSAGEAATAANPNCRVVSNALKIRVDGPPTDFSVSSNSPVCSGSNLQLNASGAASYEWYGPNGFYDNVYYAHVPSATLSDSGWYYVDVISLGGCRARDSVFVKVIGTDVHLSLSHDTAICKGNSVSLFVTGGAKYEWSPAESLSNASVNNPIATPSSTTVYSVTVSDTAGCSDSAHVTVKVKNAVAVVAAIRAPEYLCYPRDSVIMLDASSDNVTHWHWQFGNGAEDTVQNPQQQTFDIPAGQRAYNVQLIVSDTSNCADTAYHVLKVAANCYIAVPTAFTPNGDGLNDYLYPLNAYKATNLLFQVYNRNGKRVYETRDWTRKWDGTLNGLRQAAGIYVWLLEYTDDRGKKISMKGTTMLIR